MDIEKQMQLQIWRGLFTRAVSAEGVASKQLARPHQLSVFALLA
jgi:hypothetical protein